MNFRESAPRRSMAISVGHAPAPLHEFAGGEPLDDGEEVLVVLVQRAVLGFVALERPRAAADAEGAAAPRRGQEAPERLVLVRGGPAHGARCLHLCGNQPVCRVLGRAVRNRHRRGAIEGVSAEQLVSAS